MKFTATELSRNPNKVFRAAYDAKGEPITIVHGQYAEGFEIRFNQPIYAPLQGVDPEKINEALRDITQGEFTIVSAQGPHFEVGDKVTFTNAAQGNNDVPVTIPSDFDASYICPTIPLQFLPEMTDAQKDFIIRKMTHGAEITGAKLSFIDDLPGYAILSVNDVFKGPLFRCINYQMRNFFADNLEECEAKARAHAEKEKGHE